MPTTVWFDGVPWYGRALESARRHGTTVVGRLNTVARMYRDLGEGEAGPNFEVVPAFGRDGVDIPGRVRASYDGYAVIIAQRDGVVLGFTVPREDRAPR